MAKYKAISERYMTVGEVAKKMGITVRALQYYDREGIFKPSLIGEGGRRLYSDKDIVKLHQILSLKSLGFTFDELKNKLISVDTPDEVASALNEQSIVIQAQIDKLSQSLRDIEILKTEVLKMQTVDFKKYADIIVNLQMKNDNYCLIKYLDDNTLNFLREKFDKESAIAFITKISALQDKVIQYHNTGVNPDSNEGQKLASEFWQIITECTDGDMGMLSELMKLGEVKTENTEWRQKQEIFSAFLEPALEVYFKKIGINPFEVNND